MTIALGIIILIVLLYLVYFVVKTRYNTTDAVFEFVISQINKNNDHQHYYAFMIAHHHKSFVFELQNNFAKKMDSILYTSADWDQIAVRVKDYLIDKIDAYHDELE